MKMFICLTILAITLGVQGGVPLGYGSGPEPAFSSVGLDAGPSSYNPNHQGDPDAPSFPTVGKRNGFLGVPQRDTSANSRYPGL